MIEGYHKGFKVGETKHITDMDVNKITTDLTDSAKSKVISTRIRVARNLAAFPLNPGGTKETRLAIIDLMEKVFATLEGMMRSWACMLSAHCNAIRRSGRYTVSPHDDDARGNQSAC